MNMQIYISKTYSMDMQDWHGHAGLAWACRIGMGMQQGHKAIRAIRWV
jgi:hypothetical protein